MNKRKLPNRPIVCLLILTWLLTGCQNWLVPGDPASFPAGTVIFQDSFDDPTSGWENLPASPQGALEYKAGKYRIFNNSPYQMLWASSGLRFGDTRIEVDVTQTNGPEDDNFGIICRSIDRENFYFFTISADGYYGIGKVKKGIQQLLGTPAMPPSEAIHQGKTTNHLRADCIGDNLSLYVNNMQLATVQDPDFQAGEVGLMAGTFATPGVEVYFDDLKVFQP